MDQHCLGPLDSGGSSETRRGHDSHLQGPNRVQTNAELPRKLLETMPLVMLVL